MLRYGLLIACVVIVLILTPPLAGAQSGCELAGECAAPLQESYLPAGSVTLLSVYGWHPITAEWRILYLYDLASLCQNYGGYYYLASEGGAYWNSC